MSQHEKSDLLPLMPKLLRRARRLSQSRAEAEDLLQDTLLQLCKRLSRDAEIEDLAAYAMQALNNRARQQGRGPRTEEIEEDTVSVQPVVLNRLLCSEVLEAVARLPEPQRVLFELLIEGETSPAAMAERLGLPLGTVMSRLARARARLRKELQDPTGV